MRGRAIYASVASPNYLTSRNLGTYMAYRGYCTKDLAEKTLISERSLWNYLSGRKRPGDKMLLRLARALECSTEHLTGDLKLGLKKKPLP
jgi:transcriptional regulator with XRE-family HTH domain